MLHVFVYTSSDKALTEAEEIAAISAAQAGDSDATMSLIEAYGPALRKAVRSFAANEQVQQIEKEDLQSAALEGFLGLIKDHDLSKSPRLASRVNVVLTRHLASEFTAATNYAIPSRMMERFYGVLKAYDGDTEAAALAAPKHDLATQTFRDILSLVRGTGSLDSLMDDVEGLGDALKSTPIFSDSPISDAEDAILVDLAFSAVTDEQEEICRLAYGFTEYEPVPDAEIGHRMGLGRLAVLRRRASALTSMRKALGVAHVE